MINNNNDINNINNNNYSILLFTGCPLVNKGSKPTCSIY